MALPLTNLLSRGYFPKELPPPFSTNDYATVLTNVNIPFPEDTFTSTPRFSPPCFHNLVRTGGLRRNLSIPNPKHFYRLSEHLVANWSDLQIFTSSSPYSLTKPVDSKSIRAISPEHDLGERSLFRAKLRSTNKFLLKADISRFFPSIYSHSIPWALMGKSNAKLAHSNNTLKGTWEDNIDVFTRSISNNQTVGIPIGPDTSRLIAEVILTRVDLELSNKFKNLKGMRFIDDYEFVFSTRSEAEKVLSYLQHLLNEYELALNSSKTSIIELPDLLDSKWTSQIRLFHFRDAGDSGQKNDLTAYFDLIFDLFRKYPDEGLLKYAIARLNSEDVVLNNWSVFENLLSHCVLIEPACIPQVCDQIVHYMSLGHPINKRMWSSTLNRIVYERVPLGQASEAAWAIWLMKIISVKMLEKCAKVVGDTEDSIVALMALGLASEGLTSKQALKELYRFKDSDELFNGRWLLCYEGNLKSWLGSASKRANLRNDTAFLHLESQNVSFFDINVVHPKPNRFDISFGGGGGY